MLKAIFSRVAVVVEKSRQLYFRCVFWKSIDSDLHNASFGKAFADCLVAAGASNALITNIRKRMNLLNGMISSDETNLGRGYQIGHSYFVPSEGQLANQEWLDHILVYEIKPLVEEYYCDDQVQRTAALGILFGVA